MYPFLVAGCDAPVVDPIRYSPFYGPLLQWLELGLDSFRLSEMLDALEVSSWHGAPTGWVDESLAIFNEDEIVIANYLAAEGHNVIALPTRRIPGVPSADAIVSGMLAEFKTYFGKDEKRLTDKLVAARRQADRVVIRAPNIKASEAVTRVTAAMALAGCRRGLTGVRIIGANFHWEWGGWNPCIPAGDHVSAGQGG